MGMFGHAVASFYWLIQNYAGNCRSKFISKQSHGAVRHNTDPVFAEPENGQWDTLFQNDGKLCFFFCCHDNRQFPFQFGPSLCFKARLSETIDIKIIFYSQANEAHYHKKGFALALFFKVRVFGTRKWLISCQCLTGVKVKVLLNSAADGIQAKSA